MFFYRHYPATSNEAAEAFVLISTCALSSHNMAEPHLDEIRGTLERVLNELLARGDQVLDNVYMDKMVSHLSGKNGQGK